MSNQSNFLQVPGTSIGLAAPETPRTNKPNGLHRHTPSFSFGLSFLPSFNFNSPLHSASPHKFLQSSANLGKIVKEDKVLSSSPPKVAKSFLDSLASSASSSRKRSVDLDDDSTIKDDIDIWSSLGNDSNSHNLTSLTSIYEESDKENFDSNKDFLTPHKLIRNERASRKMSSDKKLPKKRKLSNVTDSPNNNIASQIASSVASPFASRLASTVNLPEHEDKVWYPELDDILINAFLKYRQFKDNHGFASSSVLANTSQNKVLSWMLLHKTGLNRNSKQIASRLFRLAKSKKLDKPSKSKTSNAQSLDELVGNPFEESMNSSTGIATMDSLPTDDIDRELDLIFSSPLNEEPARIANFNLVPKVCSVSLSKDNVVHEFTHLDPVFEPSCTFESHNPSIKQFTESIQQNYSTVQAWTIDHSINMDIDFPSHITTSTPISPFANEYQQKAVNLAEGNFKSYMQLQVECGEKITNPPPMLQWKSLCRVYDANNCQIYESDDIINGYQLMNSKYDLQIPFMKNFFLGYFHFMMNGGNPKEMNLSIVQVLYEIENENTLFDVKTSSIVGYFIHSMKAGNGQSKLGKLQLENAVNSQETDENETVLANSSPFRPSPSSTDTPSRPRNQLSIDIVQANNHTTLGPMTAPVYDASVVTQNLVKEHIRLQHQQPIQQTFQRPNMLTHSKSTNNIPQYMTTTFNDPKFGPHFNNAAVAAAAAHPTSSFSQSPDPNSIPQNLSNIQPPMAQFMPVHKQMPYQPQFIQQQNMQTPNQFPFEAPMDPSLMAGPQPHVYQVPHGQMDPMPLYPTQNPIQPFMNSAEVHQYNGMVPNSTSGGKPNMEIKFGPILGYDPSKDSRKVEHQNKAKQSNSGLHRFPVNPSLTMYQPKK